MFIIRPSGHSLSVIIGSSQEKRVDLPSSSEQLSSVLGHLLLSTFRDFVELLLYRR